MLGQCVQGAGERRRRGEWRWLMWGNDKKTERWTMTNEARQAGTSIWASVSLLAACLVVLVMDGIGS